VVTIKKAFNTLVKQLVKRMPDLKKRIKMAHMGQTPFTFVKRNLILAAYLAGTFAFLTLLMLDKVRGREFIGSTILYSVLGFIGVYIFAFFFFQNTVTVYIKRREKDLNKEVLFAGRYILIKMDSGTPFYNSLIDASKGYGVAGKFFKEIVDEIETGTTIEEALENAATYSPSKQFRQIMWQVTNALKSGIDVTHSLRSILTEIMKSHVIEIKRYGKKLSSLSMFYMLIAIIVPSLGMAMFVVLSAFISIRVKLIHLMAVVGLLAFVQFMFLALFKSIRPNINM